MIYQINKKKFLKNNKGVALFEMLPLLIVFVTLVGLTIGLWGAVHSGVLQSIAARHYAFEVINNRSHFEYHRDFEGKFSSSSVMYNNSKFAEEGNYHGDAAMRLFIVKADSSSVSSTDPYVAHRGINFFEEINRVYSDNPTGIIPAQNDTLSASFHRDSTSGQVSTIKPVNPLWLMIGYGMCLDCFCGDGDDTLCQP